jgi:mRNA interferase MazF
MCGFPSPPIVPAAWDVVTVDFPYADLLVSRKRPALVLANYAVHARFSVAWVLMITSARHSRWPGDVAVTDLAGAGVSRPCFVRTEKIATIDSRFIGLIGSLAPADRADVARQLHRLLGSVMAH